MNCVFTGGRLIFEDSYSKVQCNIQGEKTNIDIPKDIQHFLGQYDGELNCKCLDALYMTEIYTETFPVNTTLKEGIESDLLFVDDYSKVEWKSFIYNDNSFAFYQTLRNNDNPSLPIWI